MSGFLSPILKRWRLFAALASAAMLAAAHTFEHFGYAPCYLCYKQREVHWVALGVAVASMAVLRLRDDPRLRQATALLLALIFLVSTGVAIYHAGAEWKFWPGPEHCMAAAKAMTVDDLQAMLNGQVPLKPPACTEAAWRLFGISMAGYNALISMGLAALSVLAFLRDRRAT